jgi:hypothetical protein
MYLPYQNNFSVWSGTFLMSAMAAIPHCQTLQHFGIAAIADIKNVPDQTEKLF